MRVYLRNKIIPINELTWENLCDPAAYVTHEDPHITDWPDEIKERVKKVPQEIIDLLSPQPKTIFEKLLAKIGNMILDAYGFFYKS